MATKSKNTNTKGSLFTGLISWLCMMLFVFGLVSIAVGLIMISFFPSSAYVLQGSQLLRSASIESTYQLSTEDRIVAFTCLIFIDILLIFLFRKSRKQFVASLAYVLSKIWVEIKFAALLVMVLLSVQLNFSIWMVEGWVILFLYLICLDIGHNRKLFSRNITSSILAAINADNRSQYSHISKKRLASTLGVISGILLCGLFLTAFVNYLRKQGYFVFSGSKSFVIGGIVVSAIVGICGAVLWYAISMRKDLQDLNDIMKQVEEMYNGNLNAVNHIPPNSNFFDFAMQMNMIRTGIEKAVEEGVKADMTKVELITNVSHDIKTPLTSIITYIELLKKEENLPPHVNDYINTIANKADRLSHIVQDVFEVSKAATGNINLNMEDIDIGKLLHQTLAEMEETIQESDLNFRIDIPEGPLMVHADGQKLYRVFQNLIRNTVQYALENSRAYITLREAEGQAVVSIRNIARAELDTTAAEYLTGRFVRGDKTRSTEGSGLGLSIAKSFTEACGGKFDLKTDGDIFLVRVFFPILPQREAPTELAMERIEGIVD